MKNFFRKHGKEITLAVIIVVTGIYCVPLEHLAHSIAYGLL